MMVVKKKLTELQRPKRNVRMHTDKQLVEFRRSVEMFGQIRPIVIDENNVMLAGNGLYETLVSLGWEEADCLVVANLTEKQKSKLMLADNKIFDLGVDDMAAFDELLADLGDDLDVPGYDESLLKSLVADLPEVDDMMASYGTISDERKEQIRSEGAATARREESIAAKAQEYTPPPAPVSSTIDTNEPAPAQEPVRQYILCPKCGERIWL